MGFYYKVVFFIIGVLALIGLTIFFAKAVIIPLVGLLVLAVILFLVGYKLEINVLKKFSFYGGIAIIVALVVSWLIANPFAQSTIGQTGMITYNSIINTTGFAPHK